MHRLLLAAAAMLAAAGAATAQPTTPTAPQPPRVFAAAGYAQPDITPGFCKTIDASQAQCVIPAMTAGRYVVLASGTSTSTAADAAQQIQISAADQACTSTRTPDAKNPWAIGVKNTLVAACAFTIVTDAPITVQVVYRDVKATKDPRGPQVTVRREPWSGVLSATAVQVQVNQAPTPPHR
jgi:hypothetical protein